ncbi:MAG: PEP-CTERM sorting domain-containing protein, partial [Planctomycetota bacterium]
QNPDEFSVLRFVAPTSGLYQMELKWFQGDTGFVSVDVNTSTTNGLVSIASTNSYGDFGVAPIQQVNLTQGEFIELRIGRAGPLNNDSTPVSFKVTAVPEPSSLACVSGLVAGLSVLSRRRRQA